MSKTVEELQAEAADLQEKLQENRREASRAQAKQQRDKQRERAVKNPVMAEAETAKDQLYALVFGSIDGQRVLMDFAQTRPVIADMIQERIDRAKK